MANASASYDGTVTGSLAELRRQVCETNRALATHGLVTLSWGHVSGYDRERGLVVIKPTHVSHHDLRPEHMVVVDMDGVVVEGTLRPALDTPTHLTLYRSLVGIAGIAHTHSPYATMFAQARLEIPCLGSTHAEHFCGPVPVTRPLSVAETEADYERNTGRVIIERLDGLSPDIVPAVLVAGRGPFVWGDSSNAALSTAVALEAVARVAFGTIQLRQRAVPLEGHVLEAHYQRMQASRSGPGAPGAKTLPLPGMGVGQSDCVRATRSRRVPPDEG